MDEDAEIGLRERLQQSFLVSRDVSKPQTPGEQDHSFEIEPAKQVAIMDVEYLDKQDKAELLDMQAKISNPNIPLQQIRKRARALKRESQLQLQNLGSTDDSLVPARLLRQLSRRQGKKSTREALAQRVKVIEED